MREPKQARLILNHIIDLKQGITRSRYLLLYNALVSYISIKLTL